MPESAIDRREMQLRGGQPSDAADKDMTRATTLPAGKYPKDFTKLYNDFVKGYVQRPGDIAKEREAGSGPMTDRMEQLDSIKATMDYVRENPEGRQLKKLPLGMQDYIASSPEYEEWEAQQGRRALDRGTQQPWGFNPLGNPWGVPSNEGYMRPGYKGGA